MLQDIFAHEEEQSHIIASRVNWLRAAVLGANDGIISVAALLVGVAGATASTSHIFITGIAGIIAGALSMTVGEYVSVSSQRDTEIALLTKERYELETNPESELEELTQIFEHKGLNRKTAETVAKELTAKNALEAHVREELNMHPDHLTNPWHAAIASAMSFFVGATIPLIVILLAPVPFRVIETFVAVFVALILTGIMSAKASGAHTLRVTMRVVLGGILAMLITFGIGSLLGTTV